MIKKESEWMLINKDMENCFEEMNNLREIISDMYEINPNENKIVYKYKEKFHNMAEMLLDNYNKMKEEKLNQDFEDLVCNMEDLNEEDIFEVSMDIFLNCFKDDKDNRYTYAAKSKALYVYLYMKKLWGDCETFTVKISEITDKINEHGKHDMLSNGQMSYFIGVLEHFDLIKVDRVIKPHTYTFTKFEKNIAKLNINILKKIPDYEVLTMKFVVELAPDEFLEDKNLSRLLNLPISRVKELKTLMNKHFSFKILN